MLTETSLTEMQRTKRMIQMEQNIQELWNNNKGEERQKGGEEIFKRIMIENCPKLIISAKPQIQEAQRIWLLHVMLLLIHPTIMVRLTMWADYGDDAHYS